MIADDMNLAGTERELVRYSFYVNSPAGTAPYSVTSELYTDTIDPGTGFPIPDTPIAGTYCAHVVNSDGYLTVNCTPSGATLPDRVWMVLSFYALPPGWQVSGPAEVGETGDYFGLHDGVKWDTYWFSGDPHAGFEANIWTLEEDWGTTVADDFRCLGTMPVDSIHWWGSYVGWEEPDILPPELPIGWRIAFWSNVAADAQGEPNYSHPDELLWQIEIDADRVRVEQVGIDYYYEFYPLDICYQYYVDLGPDEVFWQDQFLDRTEDEIFWLSITALYPESDPLVDPCYPWGWKTRPWSWMDDAVRFQLYEEPVPGIVLDPSLVEPIKDPLYDESFDVAFELDTDPNYVKWEQPFDGIRNWPHYEDEQSMATRKTWTETKYRQDPNADGWDVAFLSEVELPLELADDWRCDETGTVDDIHFWYSWQGDTEGNIYAVTVKIYSDNPFGPFGSEPNDLKWSRTFYDNEFVWSPWPITGVQGWYDPLVPWWLYPDHSNFYYLSIDEIDEPFIQEQGNIYWLSIEMETDWLAGWKTTYDFQNDFAVWRTAGGAWQPVEADWGEPVDFAFELTTTKSEVSIDRLVADDWPCEANTPITAAVWWGSYIGYGYEACQDPQTASWMDLPVKPDHSLLNIWTDVPAPTYSCCLFHETPGCEDPVCEASVCSHDPFCCDTAWDALCVSEALADGNCDCADDLPYSHPGGILWEYRAYDYDEVLVGFDKHPHGQVVVFDGGAPDLAAGTEMTMWAQADDFALTNAATIGSVRFWTIEETAAWDGSCDYAIHTDAGGAPGALVDSGSVALGRLSTGRTFGGADEWENEFDLPAPLPLSAGTYWLVLHMSSDCLTRDGVYWETGSPGFGSTGLADGGCTGGPWVTSSYDHAFQLFSGGGPKEPVFRYSVKLPRDDWFFQDEPNGVYWFSAVAVYDQNVPDYNWGWTNHEHVYNDDAVEGYLDPPGGWFWTELFDQTGVSEDMSFILFTEPDCLNRNAPGYADWVAWGRPDCWCYPRQCRGDIDGKRILMKWVQGADLTAFRAAFLKTDAQLALIPNGICADLDHKRILMKRVQGADLTVFRAYFLQPDALVPICDQAPVNTGPYNFWTSP
jgi:hypothetical protein